VWIYIQAEDGTFYLYENYKDVGDGTKLAI